ncbi:MAG: hypothetical protein AAF602_29410, partial [Myxococcota bacterium]
GLPELTHTVLAVDILQHAIGERGDAWVGHLAMSQGEVLQGRAPARVGRAVRTQRAALDDAAASLDLGQPLPLEVTRAFGRPPLPSSLYRAAGQAGWLWRALWAGAIHRMDDRPFG